MDQLEARLELRNKTASEATGRVSKEELHRWATKVQIPSLEELQLYDNLLESK
jgi:hypothetical protein